MLIYYYKLRSFANFRLALTASKTFFNSLLGEESIIVVYSVLGSLRGMLRLLTINSCYRGT